MRRLPLFFVIGLCVICILFIAACAPGENQSTLQLPDASPAVEVAAAQDVLVNDNFTAPESSSDNNPVVEPATDDQDTSSCLECHSNAELLEQLAEEEDVPEVPSEGSG